jgi:hypothetical protein
MSRAKRLFAIFLLAIAVVLIFLPRGRNPVDDATIAQSITLYGYADDGALLWEIHARDGRIDGSGQTLSGVAIDFYGQDLSTLSIDGDRLERTEAVSRLSGNVHIQRTDDLLLEAEALTWDEAEERLESGPIELSTADLHVSAMGFGYDLETETASLTGGVEASASLEAEWTIRADRAEERDGVVVFREGVTAESEDGESFRCERLEVDTEAETARLSGDVIGDWPSGHLSAESLQLDGDGMRAAGHAMARLDLEELRTVDDT